METAGAVAEILLSMFYIRNMTKSYRKPLEKHPNYISEALPLFFGLVVLEMVLLRLRGRDGFRLTDSICSSSQGLAQETIRYTLRSCECWAYVFAWQRWRLFDVPWDTPAMFWFTMLAVDCGYYWFHRASHEVNFMWASHQVHHSSEYYNLSTALRQSWIQHYFKWIVYLPLAFIGVAPSMFFTHVQFNLVYQYWIHTELVKTIGPLEHVLNTPSHHRVHHGANVKYLDKNYAGVLIIWDRLFGTFCWEEETPTYGLVHNIESYDLWTIQMAHFRWIFNDVRQQIGWENKLRRLMCGPGWVPGTGRLGDSSTFPEPDPDRKRFDTAPPSWLQVYVLIHALIQVLPALNFAQNYLVYPAPICLLYGAVLVYNLSCIGWLLDGAWFAPLAELGRLCICLTSLSFIGWMPAAMLTAARVGCVLSLAVWLLVGARAVTNAASKANSKLQ